ncbi:hypothetical protein J4480_04110 [Candidatus Woesearchaeota archaeon]|nr:hypothetical protein [Candidatus Woesearchaeota archaeon]
MKHKIFDNKKGIGEEAFHIIIVLVIGALTIGFFKISDKIKSDKAMEAIQREKDIVDGHEALMEYLTKVHENGNKADFISKLVIEKKYDVVKQDITDHFNQKLDNMNWHIDVKDSQGKLILPSITNTQYSPQEQYTSTQSTYRVASAFIPLDDQANYILIELFFST